LSTTSLAVGTPNKVQVSSTLTLVRAAPGNLDDPAGWTYTGPAFANGTAAGQVDRRYIAQLTIAASGSTILNLSSLVDSFGNTFAFLRIKEIYVELTKGTAAASVLVGNATNPFVNWISPATATIQVRNGMTLFLGDCQDATGYVVTASTGDQFKILNQDAGLSAIVNVNLLGCSA
jgi:hypothetical protein